MRAAEKPPLRQLNWLKIQENGRAPAGSWLVINRPVYDITRFRWRHPGGSRLIAHYAGKDVTKSNKSTMGFFMSKSMDQSLKKQQEFMVLNSRLQLERQIQMQNQMRERQMAMQIAWSREFLNYYGAFFGLATLGLTAGALKRRRPGLFIPVVPLSFILAYQIDLAYGTLMQRVK
ncbi:hypothetical protein COCON_G00212960, partial [Conger conger]